MLTTIKISAYTIRTEMPDSRMRRCQSHLRRMASVQLRTSTLCSRGRRWRTSGGVGNTVVVPAHMEPAANNPRFRLIKYCVIMTMFLSTWLFLLTWPIALPRPSIPSRPVLSVRQNPTSWCQVMANTSWGKPMRFFMFPAYFTVYNVVLYRSYMSDNFLHISNVFQHFLM